MSWAASSWAASSRQLGLCAVIGICAAVAAWPGAATSQPMSLPPEVKEAVDAAVEAKKSELQAEGAWITVKDTRDPETLRRFIAQFPGSPHRPEADELIKALQRQAPPAGPEPVVPPVEPPSKLRTNAAKDLARLVREKFRRDGPEATYDAINARKFNNSDLYPFVIDFDGNEPANGGSKDLRGSVINLRDENGKYIIEGLIDTARKGGGQWYRYRWPKYDRAGKPIGTTTEYKWSWVERLDNDRLVGVGVYDNPNQTTVHIIAGSSNSDDTYLQTASDLAEVFHDDDNVRVLWSFGTGGPVQNIRDVLYEKGIEIGLTQVDILDNFRFLNKPTPPKTNETRIVYIAPLFNEEVHLVAGKGITRIEDLANKKVNIGAEGSGTSFSMRGIFHALTIHVDEVSMSQAEALQKVESGEIAATALVAGKPARPMSGLTGASGLHFVPIRSSDSLKKATYVSASLTHDDYPDLIPAGPPVETVAVGTVLITYDWEKGADRYQVVEKFVNAFFSRIDDFKQRHPKWREVDLHAPVPATLADWRRFGAAQIWIDSHPDRKSGD